METDTLFLYLPFYSCTQSQESRERLSNQNLRFSDTPFPVGFHIERVIKKQIRKWKEVWKQMSIFVSAPNLQFSSPGWSSSIGWPLQEAWVDAEVCDKWMLTEAVPQWGHGGMSWLLRKGSSTEAEKPGCQSQWRDDFCCVRAEASLDNLQPFVIEVEAVGQLEN